MPFDLGPVRASNGGDLAHIYLALQKQHSDSYITESLLDALRNESILPIAFGTWLRVCHSNEALGLALNQDFSCLVRKYAIKQLGSRMRGSSWEPLWNELGGVEGMLALFAKFSVVEVRHASQAIGRCRKGQPRPSREKGVESLLRGLVPYFHTEAHLKSYDQRPLLPYYAHIVPACSCQFVEQVLSRNGNPLLPYIKYSHIARYHPLVARQHVFEEISSGHSDSHDRFWPDVPKLTRHLPSSQRDSTGFTPTMLFALSVLSELVRNRNAKVEEQMFMTHVAAPLISRAVDNKVSHEKVTEIVKAVLNYTERNPTAAQHFSSKSGGFLHSPTRYWSHRGGTQDTVLTNKLAQCFDFFGNEPAGTSHRSLAGDLFPLVSKKHRYTLLRLIMKNYARPRIDLDDIEQLKSESFDGFCFRSQLFLDPDLLDAQALLERLLHVRKKSNFLASVSGCSILNHRIALEAVPGPDGDPRLLYTLLTRGKPDALARAKQDIGELKKKSSTSRDQPARAFFARSAMFYAIASGSLSLYADVLKWSRRYIRDPLTVKTIYDHESMITEEGLDLLSGFCDKSLLRYTFVVEEWRTQEANLVLIDIFEIALSAISEPSFYVHDWAAILGIFRGVVERRLEVTALIQSRLGLSDDVLYQKVWKDTIAMLIKIERSACMPEHQRLNFNTSFGPLLNVRPHFLRKPQPKSYPGSSYYFIDRLAEARDELWKEVRPLTHPAAATLQRPWPRGLPLQSLTAVFSVAEEEARDLTPFISSRAAEVVFLNADVALSAIPSDDESQAAIGSFVDSYDVALRIHVMQQLEGPVKNKEISRAWEHALASLTRMRIDSKSDTFSIRSPISKSTNDDFAGYTEAIRMWRSRFFRTLSSLETVIPIVGRLTERQSAGEQALVALEHWNDLPIIEDETYPQPIFCLLLNAASDPDMVLDACRNLVEKIILPAYDASVRLHSKWVEQFLKQMNGLPELESLTPIPPRPNMLAKMLHRIPQFVPAKCFETWHQYALTNLSRNDNLEFFNKRLKNVSLDDDKKGTSKSAQDEKAQRHWLQIYDEGVKVLDSYTITELLRKDIPQSFVDFTGLTITRMQEFVLKQASTLIYNYDNRHA